MCQVIQVVYFTNSQSSDAAAEATDSPPPSAAALGLPRVFFFFFFLSLSCCVDVLECNEQSLSFVNRCQGSEQTLQPSRPETDRRGRKEKEPTDDVPQSTYVEPHRCP